MNEAIVEQKEQKHLIISNCIRELESEVSRLENLLSKIDGSETKEPGKEPEQPQISLVTFLDDTPGRLNELTKNLNDCRQKLQAYLF